MAPLNHKIIAGPLILAGGLVLFRVLLEHTSASSMTEAPGSLA